MIMRMWNFLQSKCVDKGTKNLTIEYRFKCADGSYKYILDRSYLIVDENNKPKRIIGSMQDITERKRAFNCDRDS